MVASPSCELSLKDSLCRFADESNGKLGGNSGGDISWLSGLNRVESKPPSSPSPSTPAGSSPLPPGSKAPANTPLPQIAASRGNGSDDLLVKISEQNTAISVLEAEKHALEESLRHMKEIETSECMASVRRKEPDPVRKKRKRKPNWSRNKNTLLQHCSLKEISAPHRSRGYGRSKQVSRLGRYGVPCLISRQLCTRQNDCCRKSARLPVCCKAAYNNSRPKALLHRPS